MRGDQSFSPLPTEVTLEATALKELLERRDALTTELRSLTHDENGQEIAELSPEAEARSSEILDEVEELDQGIDAEAKRVKQVSRLAEARQLANLDSGRGTQDGTQAAVVSEPMIYGCNEKYQGRHSWWADQITVANGPTDPFYAPALDRQLRWGHQVEVEVANDTEFGRHALTQFRDRFRENTGVRAFAVEEEIRRRGRGNALASEDEIRNMAAHGFGIATEEFRISGVGTGGGPTVAATSGASSFITPVFVGPYVPYKEYGRCFADQCAKPPMPAYGMGIFKPQVTGGAGDGAFTELGTVTEVDPTVGYLAGALGIYAGEVTLSQAVIDRTAPDFRYDLMVQDQIERKEAPVLDAYVIGKAITNGATVIPYTAAFAVASTSGVTSSLYGHVSQAKAVMRSTVGQVLNPTHVWLTPTRWEVVAAWGDANGRPVTIPEYAGPFQALAAGSADGDAGVEGATGYRFNGLRAFTDPNLPTTGGTANLDQVLVTCQPEIEYYEATAVNRILPQTLAANLATIVQRYRYVTVIENYASATQPIQGAAFTAPSWGS